MKTEFAKPRINVLTDPELIESARRDNVHDVIGAEIKGVWYAYTVSIEHYRRQQLRSREEVK